MKSFFSALLAAILLLLTQSIFAQVPGDEASDIAFDPEMNRYLVVYTYYPSTGKEVYGQFIDNTGNPSGEGFAISEMGSDEQVFPMVEWDPGKRLYLVVWKDDRNTNMQIWGQFVRQDGSLKGENFQIHANSVTPYYLAMKRDSVNNRYLILWQENTVADNDEIFGELLDQDGTTIKDAFPISIASGNQVFPAAAFDNSNEKYFVVWQDIDSQNIIGKFLDKDATVDDTEITVSNEAHSQSKPRVAFAPEVKRYLVVFEDNRNGLSVDIYSQAITAAGGAQGTDVNNNQALCTADDAQVFPTLAKGSTSQDFLVIWQDNRNATLKKGVSSYDSYAQFVGDGGTTSGDNFIVIDGTLQLRNVLPTYNSNCSNFLITYTTITEDPEYGINYKIQGDTCSGSPSAPMLKSPTNGATDVSTSPTLDWDPSTDPDGDDVNYSVLLCENQYFEDCTSTTVSSASKVDDNYTGAALALWLLICPAGFLFMRRKKKGTLASFLAALLILCTFIVMQCSSSSEDQDAASYKATGLTAGTTYYWRIKANDGSGGISNSETWSFTTTAE